MIKWRIRCLISYKHYQCIRLIFYYSQDYVEYSTLLFEQSVFLVTLTYWCRRGICTISLLVMTFILNEYGEKQYSCMVMVVLHYTLQNRYSECIFLVRVISHYSPYYLETSSPNLKHCNFCFWVLIKNLMYRDNITFLLHLKDDIICHIFIEFHGILYDHLPNNLYSDIKWWLTGKFLHLMCRLFFI